MRILVGTLAVSLWAAEPDGRQVLEKAAEVCRRVQSIQYQIKEEFGDRVAFASVVQARANVPDLGFAPGKFRVFGETKTGGTYGFAYDGVWLRKLEPKEKVILAIKSPSQYVTGQILAEEGLSGFAWFTLAEPFKEQLEKPDRITYQGRTSIGGVDCHVVEVELTRKIADLPPTKNVTRFFIGVEDSMPRGFETGRYRKVITSFQLNPAARDFALPVLEGYREQVVTGPRPRLQNLLAVGTQAPAFSLKNGAGEETSLSSLKGRVVLLDFWGTWCVPCRRTMPVIQRLHQKFGERGLAVYGVAVADQEGNPAAYMKAKNYTYGLLLGGDDVAKAYGALMLPTVYLLGKDGKILHAESGVREAAEAQLGSMIEAALK